MRYKIIISMRGEFEVWLADSRGKLLQLVGTVAKYSKAISLGKGYIRSMKAVQRNPAIRTAKLVQL